LPENFIKSFKENEVCFFPNHDDMEEFSKRKYVTQKQIRRVPGSGVNLEQFAPMPSTRGNDGKFIFLFISRLLKDKGTMEYVEAASLLKEKFPQAEFHVIGLFGRAIKSL
jgi:glycosyltransferase involved in cell wall biosynthesis